MDKLITSLNQPDGASTFDLVDLRLQAQMPHFSSGRHVACEPTDRQREQDIIAAKLLLQNETLFTSSVAQLAPNVAER